MAASGDPTFERCRPRKRDSETEFPVRKSTSEISESFPFVKRALAEIENGLNYFRKSITSDATEPKITVQKADTPNTTVVVVAASEDDPSPSPPPPMTLKERRGSRGSPCANLPPLMIPSFTPEPSPGRLSPSRISPQPPKVPASAPVVANPPRRTRTRSEVPPDPPPRSPETPRPASVSPKHTFAFKIVLKKVESTPNTSFDRPEQ